MPVNRIFVAHGPNLNMLGQREQHHYGQATLEQINARLTALGEEHRYDVVTFQSNHEGALIDQIQAQKAAQTQFIIFNPGAYTHTSVALRDALLAVNIPFIEVHVSNVFSREAFRHHSYFTDIAVGHISGFGAYSYELALLAAFRYLSA